MDSFIVHENALKTIGNLYLFLDFKFISIYRCIIPKFRIRLELYPKIYGGKYIYVKK